MFVEMSDVAPINLGFVSITLRHRVFLLLQASVVAVFPPPFSESAARVAAKKMYELQSIARPNSGSPGTF